jgi:P27 family predicted phage terminase small subunit
LTNAPPPPAGIVALAAAEWRVLAPVLCDLGTLTTADLRALRLLCETLAAVADLAEVLGREGHTVPAGSGGVKGHPAAQALATARAQAHRLLADFGLTPRSRAGVDQAPDAEDDDDPAAAYFR